MSSEQGLAELFPGVPYSEGTTEGGLERLYRVASWEWLGEDGTGVPWDLDSTRRLLVGLLKREGGAMFVGGQLSLAFFPPFRMDHVAHSF